MQFVLFWCFVFICLFSCDIGDLIVVRYGFCSSLIFGQLTHRAVLLVSVNLILSFHLIVVSLFSSCVFPSLCAASVVLAPVFMPGLCSAAYRAAFLAHPAEERIMWLPFVCFFCLCFCLCLCFSLIPFYFIFIFVSSVPLCAWRRCPLLATFLSVVFCLFSLLFSERVPV